jgi:hypothetical protein
MKAFLMYRDRDIDLGWEPAEHHETLIQDLDLDTLLGAMARGDRFLSDMARAMILASVGDPETIRYRQDVLRDCLHHPSVLMAMYDLAVEATMAERKLYLFLSKEASPEMVIGRSVALLERYVDVLKGLRAIAEEHRDGFRSEGFTRFFAMLVDELGDEYFARIQEHLKELKFPRGVLIGAGLGRGNKGTGYVLRRIPQRTWRERFGLGGRSGFSFTIAERDESGFRALGDLRARGIHPAADALARSADHILDFFRILRAELASYVGALNLHTALSQLGQPTCFPTPEPVGAPVLSARGLRDVGLALRLGAGLVGNDVDADGRSLVMITGANQGGKSTFLRSVGLAQLMMQCGMFVAADSFRADVRDGVFTHFRREEDAAMESGKFDEELARMSRIADLIDANGMLLCNESFAATNEREGSEIARHVIRAFVDAGVKVLFVTHLFDLAHGFLERGPQTALFLRAERRPDGGRTFRLLEGPPLPTSYGHDSYRRIFGPADHDAAVPSREGAR